jgi:hypothetical protein
MKKTDIMIACDGKQIHLVQTTTGGGYGRGIEQRTVGLDVPAARALIHQLSEAIRMCEAHA